MNGRKVTLAIAAFGLAAGIGMQLQALPLAHAAHAAMAHKNIIVTERNNQYLFSPKKATVKVGTKVTWTNKSDTAHTVTGTNGWMFKSKTVQPKGSVSFTFTKAGTYHYMCTIHTYMKAMVVVTK